MGLEAQAYTFEMQLAHGWLSLLDQQQEVLHSIHAHTKAYALIASLLSHIKKQHLRLSEELLKVLIERKIIHHDTKIEAWIDRAQRVHTALQQNMREDERSSTQRKDLLQTLVLEEGRIPSLKSYLTRVHEYALALW